MIDGTFNNTQGGYIIRGRVESKVKQRRLVFGHRMLLATNKHASSSIFSDLTVVEVLIGQAMYRKLRAIVFLSRK